MSSKTGSLINCCAADGTKSTAMGLFKKFLRQSDLILLVHDIPFQPFEEAKKVCAGGHDHVINADLISDLRAVKQPVPDIRKS